MKLLTKDPLASPISVLDDVEHRAALRMQRQYRAQSEGTLAAGGWVLPPTIDPSVVVSDFGSTNFYMNLCRIEDIQTHEWRGLTSTGKSWAFKSEGQGAAAADVSMTGIMQPVISVHIAMGFVDFSIEIGGTGSDGDWPAFAKNMTAALSQGYSES